MHTYKKKSFIGVFVKWKCSNTKVPILYNDIFVFFFCRDDELWCLEFSWLGLFLDNGIYSKHAYMYFVYEHRMYKIADIILGQVNDFISYITKYLSTFFLPFT